MYIHSDHPENIINSWVVTMHYFYIFDTKNNDQYMAGILMFF